MAVWPRGIRLFLSGGILFVMMCVRGNSTWNISLAPGEVISKPLDSSSRGCRNFYTARVNPRGKSRCRKKRKKKGKNERKESERQMNRHARVLSRELRNSTTSFPERVALAPAARPIPDIIHRPTFPRNSFARLIVADERAFLFVRPRWKTSSQLRNANVQRRGSVLHS